MEEVRRSTRTFYVIQFYGKDYYRQVPMWRDDFKYSDIRHINEATKVLGKLRRGAMYEKTSVKYRMVKRTVETIVNVENEIID